MYFFRLLLAVSVLTAITTPARADDSQRDDKAMLAPLQAIVPELKVTSIEKTPVEGIYQVDIEAGPTVYMSRDGKHFFQGEFIEVGKEKLVNLGEKALEAARVDALAAVPLEEMIVFGPDQPKAFVSVFTDVDCYYCQKLHQEVAALSDLGVQVRYLAYPRAGIGSQSYKKIASAWCADDPNAAITALKAGEDIDEDVCDGNPVPQQYELGGTLGVRGTPALITESGRLLPGYMPAEKLAKELGL